MHRAAATIADSIHDLLADPDSVIEGTCVEITNQQPLLPAACSDNRDEMIVAAQGRQVDLDGEIARLQQQIDAWNRTEHGAETKQTLIKQTLMSVIR